jgi:hypothetical protein
LQTIERHWTTHLSTGDEIDSGTVVRVRSILAEHWLRYREPQSCAPLKAGLAARIRGDFGAIKFYTEAIDTGSLSDANRAEIALEFSWRDLG